MRGEPMNTRRMLVALGIVALMAAACGGDDASSENASGSGGGGGGGAATTVTASDFAFDPESVTVAAGDGIELVNDGEAEHNITAEDAGLDEDVDAGDTVTIDTSGVEPGSYDFFCEYHPDQMKGTLEVAE
jgi:plastocyanin